MIRRRNFLAAGLSALIATPVGAAIPDGEPRRLALVRSDNGERFAGPYRGAQGYDPVALGEFAHFMRDRHVERMIAVDPALLDLLSEVLAAARAPEATLLSGYRSPETNAKLAKTQFGVAERSHHIEGRAIDFWIPQRLVDAVQAARRLQRGGVGWYPGSNFIHLDTGPTRYWVLQGAGLRGLLGVRAKKHRNLALEQCLKDPARRARCGQRAAIRPAPRG
ncbi:MAG: DUF882 domain-containing protein [Phreatobacter sp.]|uniref:YcbK family protein n=1 Tax=Phreatobacter sp. TaxID=1966341 RepID=UPI001A5E0217|nr:DUF882 domain-containing protein [Phreatobacter sp.]MBL8571826.1 DUF882 domain-containing protein [Phreatobacter sp.]